MSWSIGYYSNDPVDYTVLGYLCTSLCVPDTNSTSQAAKNRSMWKELGSSTTNGHPLHPIFVVLIDLYDGKDVYEELEACRINPDYTSNSLLRNDLEFYIPQLTNFMVFHSDFANDKLGLFLEQWSKADPYFSHLYYWCISSLSITVNEEKAHGIIRRILEDDFTGNHIKMFDKDYETFFSGLRFSLGEESYEKEMEKINSRKTKAAEIIKNYKETHSYYELDYFALKASDIDLKPYASPFVQEQEFCEKASTPFTSVLMFVEDICFIAEEIVQSKDPLGSLKDLLITLNAAISPSYVYLPLVKESIRHYVVANIVIEETKVFSTKQRAPFAICLELFRPQEELAYEFSSLLPPKAVTPLKKRPSILEWAKEKLFLTEIKQTRPSQTQQLDALVSKPVTLKNLRVGRHSMTLSKINNQHNINLLDDSEISSPKLQTSKSKIEHGSGVEENKAEDEADPIRSVKRYMSEDFSRTSLNIWKKKESPDISEAVSPRRSILKSGSIRKSPFSKYLLNVDTEAHLEPKEEDEKETEVNEKNTCVDENKSLAGRSIEPENYQHYFFGEDSDAQAERIRKQSPFGRMKTWRLAHLIIKSGADMKEEQFAIQLISKFEHIFKLEKLKLMLSPYEILSLGENVGMVEMVKDAVTISKLKEKIYLQNMTTLNEFFEKFYGRDVYKARKQFCKSLAAYSLVCYFLQIKDRHNGNIMLHKDGHIVHIDFGFFLSNVPGKGIDFEKSIPFKFMNEDIEVLEGPRSKLFQKFRSLFYKFDEYKIMVIVTPYRGFMAARKHKEQILILVKMMYSSYSQNFPCFKGGIKAITELEERFSPPDVNESDMKEYCYHLINQSVDNWRAKCYDKYQYFVQGIFY